MERSEVSFRAWQFALSDLIVIDDKYLRGFATMQPTGFITYVYVDTAQRGKGVGSGLLAECIKRAKALGLSEVTLIAEPAEKENREKLLRFYARQGFEVVEGNQLKREI